jgi:hypothetical protein
MDRETDRQKDGQIDRETGMVKLIVVFGNLANALKNNGYDLFGFTEVRILA